MARCVRWLVLCGILAGCQATPPDVAGDISRATGMENAIVFLGNAPLAETPEVEGGLPLSEAVRLALAHDPRIQASLARVRMAEADANQARLLPNPIMNIDVRFPTTAGNNTAVEATLSGDLLMLLQKPGEISAADDRLRGAAADALTTVLDVIAEVQETYSAARSVDAEIDNAKARLDILQKLRDIAQKRLTAGDITRLDVLTLDSQLMQAQLDVTDLELERTTERLTLARQIGAPRSAAAWTLATWELPADNTLAPEGEWIDAAMAHRPEIRAKMWELRALGGDLAAASFAPLGGGEVGVHSEHDPDWRVGPTITVPLPLFDWGQAARTKIEAQQIATLRDLDEQRLTVIQEIRVAHATLAHTTQALADARDKLLPLQRQQLDLAQKAYQAGEADLATFLLAETDLQLTLSKLIELQEKVTVARLKLERAAGGAGVAPVSVTPSTSRPATGTAP